MHRASPTVLVIVATAACSMLVASSARADVSPSPIPTSSSSSDATPSATPTPDPTVSAPAPTASTAPSTAPTPTAKPVVVRTTLPLRFDDRGPMVARAQQRLMWLGYTLSENSQDKQLFGITMRKAVKDFQYKNWLPTTGKVDKKTWKKLTRLAEPVGILPLRCTEVKKAICIDKSTKLLRYVVKGKVKMIADARFGAPGMETGEGIFSVKQKSYNHVSSLYHSWMPRAMFFNGDEAVHYSPDFASVGYSRGSHGCVGIRDMEKATWLYDQVPVGTRVYVYWS